MNTIDNAAELKHAFFEHFRHDLHMLLSITFQANRHLLPEEWTSPSEIPRETLATAARWQLPNNIGEHELDSLKRFALLHIAERLSSNNPTNN